ncbi:NAD(P)/FAD-dependent oxidoreductase [Nocardioides sp. SLBN-35]|uniref:FAD-dependent oxidoreductase n=1 Tax=Nocardioides sp. SLBN-35 TaxID=2768445 RepID=UPI001153F823|nr:NAD(P)/FAD-dependent oxidoreductase [Nocardioides sp. SLBN-35]TQK68921.1 kynurenine 3-monooxygenase [Nocardioides sp. SLBN-35]
MAENTFTGIDGEPVRRVAVVGAGLAGCLMAVLLARRGLAVDLYERRSDPRLVGAERGRSINLAISARGLDALSRVGLDEQALAAALPMHGRTLHGTDGKVGYQSYSADGTRAINSISRSGLNASLLDCAEQTPGVTLHFGHQLRTLDAGTGELVLGTDDGEVTATADIVIGSDGAYSAVRRAIQFTEGFDFSQSFLSHGYKELTIPATADGDFALDERSLHIWPRGSSMMIALPNLDRSFTCTLFWPKTGPGGFAALESADEIDAYFRTHYPDAHPLMPTLVEDFQHNPVGSLVTVRAFPWVRDRVALLGDAAHAIVPFFGQGANCSFEDCIELDRCLSDSAGDWAVALRLYQDRRKPNADAIAEMALENFVEMSDKVNSKVFQAITSTRHFLERRLPERYVSRYELVSFTTTPYAQVNGRIRRQDMIAGAVAAAAVGGAALAARALRRRE